MDDRVRQNTGTDMILKAGSGQGDIADALYGSGLKVDITANNDSAAGGATKQGTAFSKANVLPDGLAAKLGLSGNPTPADAFEAIVATTMRQGKMLRAGSGPASLLTSGAFINLNHRYLSEHLGPGPAVSEVSNALKLPDVYNFAEVVFSIQVKTTAWSGSLVNFSVFVEPMINGAVAAFGVPVSVEKLGTSYATDTMAYPTVIFALPSGDCNLSFRVSGGSSGITAQVDVEYVLKLYT